MVCDAPRWIKIAGKCPISSHSVAGPYMSALYPQYWYLSTPVAMELDLYFMTA